MKVLLQPALNDANLDSNQSNSQRQLAISISALTQEIERCAPNLCLILDHSGSMNGRPLETVKKSAQRLVDRLSPGDASVVVFDHRAKVLVSNQIIDNPDRIKITGLLPKVEPQLMKGCDWELRNRAKKRNDFPSVSLDRRRK